MKKILIIFSAIILVVAGFTTIVFADYNGAINQTYTYRAIATDPDTGDRLQYEFSWGDASPVENWPSSGTISENTAQNATHSFGSTSNYQTFTVAFDDQGARSGNSNIVTSNVAPPSRPGDTKLCQVSVSGNWNASCVSSAVAGANTGSFTFAWNASDPWYQTLVSQYIAQRSVTGPSGSSVDTVYVSANHGSGTSVWGLSESGLSTGCYTYQIQAEDNVSPTSNLSVTSPVSGDIIVDAMAPQVMSAPSMQGAINNYINSTEPLIWEFSGTTDNGNNDCWDTGLDEYDFKITSDSAGNTIIEGPVVINETGLATYTYTQLTSVAGTYYAFVRGVDTVGNVGTWSPAGQVTVVSGTPPTAGWDYCSPDLSNIVQFADLSDPAPGETINYWLWDYGNGDTCDSNTDPNCDGPLYAYIPDTDPPPAPTCIPTSQVFNNSIQVTCSDLEPGVIIRYTIDATDPVITSSSYVAPFTFIANTTLRVRAWDASENASGITEYIYTLNEGPVASDDSASTLMDNAIIISVLANDSDSNGLDVTSVTIVTDGSSGGAVANIDGTVTYTPDPGVTGIDTFTYTVDDTLGAVSNIATVTVNVTTNPAPVANDDTATTNANIAVDIDVTANDTDDGSIDTTTVSIQGGPSNGSTSVDPVTGVVTYTPDPGYLGNDVFTYNVQDNLGAVSNIATVNITVSPATWTRRRKITFNNSAQSENLVNIPVMIKLNDPARIDYALTQNQGEDIRFYDSDDVTALDYEIESWNESGDSYVWVRVPQINGSSNTDFIWMYYGNSGASDAQNPSGVWSNNYKGIWHMDEEQAGTGNTGVYTDSSGSGCSGTDNISATGQTGKINGGQQFDGNNDYVALGTCPSVFGTSNFSASAWIKTSATNQVILQQRDPGFNGEWEMHVNNSGRVYFYVYSGGSYQCKVTSNSTVNNNAWHNIAVTRSGNLLAIVIDGVLSGYCTGTPRSLSSSFTTQIGYDLLDNNKGFNGYIDEVRIDGVTRSEDWAAAQYDSMNDTFASFGSEEVVLVEKDTQIAQNIIEGKNQPKIAGSKAQRSLMAFFTNLKNSITNFVANFFRGETSFAQVSWWNTDWQNRRQITLDNTGRGALSNVPILITLTNTRTNSYTNFSDGSEIRFTDSSGIELNHEIEKWNTLDNSYIWVKVPTLANNGTTDIYMYYNYTGGSIPSPLTSTGVWDNNYKMVLHLNDDFNDSTANSHNGINNGSVDINGQIGDGQDFSGSGQWIEVTDHSDFDPENGITLEAYVYNEDAGGEWRGIYTKGRDAGSSPYWTGFWRTSGIPGRFRLNGGTNRFDDPTSAPTYTWRYLVGTVAQGGIIEMFQNGSSLGTASAIAGQPNNGTENIAIGRALGISEYFDGRIDEVRWSNTIRTDDWIGAQNESMTDSLISIWGAEETYSAGAPAAPTNLAVGTTQTTANLTWTDNATNEEEYRIYRNTTNVKPVGALAIIATDSESYNDPGPLVCGSVYYWWVEAYDADTSTGSDAVISEITQSCAGAGGPFDVYLTVQQTNGAHDTSGTIVAPYNISNTIDFNRSCKFELLNVEAPTCTSIEVVEWTHANAANQYVIFWDDDTNPVNGSIGSAVVARDGVECSATGCTYSIQNLTPATLYYVYVQAQPSGFYSDYGACSGDQSNVCPVAQMTPPCPVTNVQADVNECGAITVNWEPALGADGGYDIYKDVNVSTLPIDGQTPGSATALNTTNLPGQGDFTLNAGRIEFRDKKILTRQEYHYRVFAFNADGDVAEGKDVKARNFCFKGPEFEEK